MKIRVKLTEAAHALLETDRPELNEGRHIDVEGAYVVGEHEAIGSLCDHFSMYVSGAAGVDNPGAAKKAAEGAIRAIDKELARAARGERR